jgi:hypothetical protein
MLGYTRPTVRQYSAAAQRLQIERDAEKRSDLEWEGVARRVQERLARHRPAGTATAAVAAHHAYLAAQVGQVALMVLH